MLRFSELEKYPGKSANRLTHRVSVKLRDLDVKRFVRPPDIPAYLEGDLGQEDELQVLVGDGENLLSLGHVELGAAFVRVNI